MNLQGLIDELFVKTNLLLKEKQGLHTEVERQRKQLEELEKVVENQKNTIETLKEQNKLIKLAGTLNATPEADKEMIQVINQYIREIDECIRLIGDSKL